MQQKLAMLFDLDGVLVHSMPLHTAAWEQYLSGLGMHFDDFDQRMHGKRNAELVRDLFGDGLDEQTVFQHGAAKEQLWRDLMLQTGVAKFRVPGVDEFLERHKDIPKAIGSNAELTNIEFVLDHFHLRQYFQAIVNGMDVARPKPFPDIYLLAAERLQIEPSRCIVFEDSPTGAAAGIAAGMRVVGVETTPTTFQGVALQVKDFQDPQLETWLAVQLQTSV